MDEAQVRWVGAYFWASRAANQAKLFEAAEDPTAAKSFFHEITASISHARFSRCGRYIAARDYMGVRLWDVKMESKPLKTFTVHEALRPKLCELYKNDCIFDKFEVGFSHDSQHLVTGSYGNNFHVLSLDGTHAVEGGSRERERSGKGVGSWRSELEAAGSTARAAGG